MSHLRQAMIASDRRKGCGNGSFSRRIQRVSVIRLLTIPEAFRSRNRKSVSLGDSELERMLHRISMCSLMLGQANRLGRPAASTVMVHDREETVSAITTDRSAITR